MTSDIPTVMYVEDDLGNRVLVRRILQSEGYKVIEAENASQALFMLEKEQPDIILMDINMPDVDGYTLTTRLKTMPKIQNIPIIAVSAKVLKGDREKAIAAGCNGYIEKPINVDTLSQIINQYIHEAKHGRRNFPQSNQHTTY
ncbi:MAG: response regulator [Anaerolineae bacterium]|nr:response regulator [Anaerolineae bacterium]